MDVLGLREIFCFVLHGCTILIDRKQRHKIYFDKYFTVWVLSVQYQHDCFFLDECLNEKFRFAYFDKKENKSIVSVFIIILLVCCVFIVSWIGKIDDLFIVLIFIRFCCGSIEKLILIVFFQIYEFLQKTTQFQRNNLNLFSDETTRWFFFFR